MHTVFMWKKIKYKELWEDRIADFKQMVCLIPWFPNNMLIYIFYYIMRMNIIW